MTNSQRDFWRRLNHWFRIALWFIRGQPQLPEWTTERRAQTTIHSGFFAVYDRFGYPCLSVQGRVVEWPGLPTDVYLYDPPLELRKHQHGSCLQLLRPGEAWFKMHWQKPARDFGQSCAYIEQLLAEVS
jgi:hypothetical protein